MRIYNKEHSQKIEQIICNQCGRPLQMNSDIITEGVFSGEVTWGYFSKHDGEHHSFDLCERCYEEMVGRFQISPTITVETELL